MFYQYYCEANDKTVEVEHKMSKKLKTWGEVCAKAGIDLGDTPPNAPVVRLISGMPFDPKVKGLDKDAPSDKLEI